LASEGKAKVGWAMFLGRGLKKMGLEGVHECLSWMWSGKGEEEIEVLVHLYLAIEGLM
jgi:hypothetical protein